MLEKMALPEMLLFGGWAVMWAAAPWPFFFIHWLGLGLALSGALSLRPIIQLQKNFLYLLGGPLALWVGMWFNNYLQCKEPFSLPGPYVFWLATPLIVYGFQNSYGPILLSRAWKVLTLSTLALGVYGVVAIVIQGFLPVYLPEHSWTFRFREEFARHTGLHPPYFGMFAAAVIVYLSDRASEAETKKHRLSLLAGLLVLLGLLGLLETRIHLVMLFVAFMIFRPSLRRYVVPLALVLVTILIFKGGNRFREFFSPEQNSATLRLESWRCGLRAFREAPFTGQGSCRLQTRLNACYDAGNFHLQGMNTHNQFLHFAAAGGIPALILWLLWWVLLARFLKGSHVSTSRVQALLLLGFCLTENVLERQWGGLLAGLVLAGVLYAPSERALT